MTKNTITLEQFKLLSPQEQMKHIDITIAPSYAKWYRCALVNARHRDAKYFIEGQGRNEEWFLTRCKSLGQIGFDLAFSAGKTREYAQAVAEELGLHPRVNQGKLKGTDWPAEELYGRLPE